MAQFLDNASVPFDYYSTPKRAPNETITRALAPRPPARPPIKAPQPMDLLEKAYADYQKSYAAANAENLRRDAASLAVVGLDPSGKPLPGFEYGMGPGGAGAGNVSSFVSSGSGGTAGSGSPGGSSSSMIGAGINQFGGGTLSTPAYGASTGQMYKNAINMGIFNTSRVLNRGQVLNSVDAANAQNSIADRKFREEQAMREENARVMNPRLQLLTGRQDQLPDPTPILEAARELGRGTQEQIDDDAYGGGYGGGGPIIGSPQMLGYNVPFGAYGLGPIAAGPAYSAPQKWKMQQQQRRLPPPRPITPKRVSPSSIVPGIKYGTESYMPQTATRGYSMIA